MSTYNPNSTIRFQHEEHHWLTFECKPVSASVKSGVAGRFTFGDFSVMESIRHPERPQSKNPATESEYTIKFFYKTKSEADVDSGFSKFTLLENEIDAVWHYVFGFTYNGDDRYSSTAKRTRGWKDNAATILPVLQPENPLIYVEFKSMPVLELNAWPLRRLLRALTDYRKESDTIKFLMNLHAQAQNTADQDVQLVLWGKLLDLCELLLPGNNRVDQIASLPPLFKDRLVFDSSVFRIANTRSLTRHAASKDGKLYPGMTAGEIEDFRSDVDTLARAVVYSRIPIQPLFYDGWRFPANCSVRYSGQIGKVRSRLRKNSIQ